MIKKIQYEDKVAIQNDETIPTKNKVTDTDINEIKSVVNNNADELEATNERIDNIPQYDDTEIKEDIETLKEENEDLKEQLKDRQNNELKGTVSGTEIDLNDSSDSRVNEIGLSGNSVQETTTGKNKFKMTEGTASSSGITISTDSSAEAVFNGTASNGNSWIEVNANNVKSGTEKKTTPMFNLDSSKNYTFSIKLVSGTISSNNLSFGVQIDENDTLKNINYANSNSSTFTGATGIYRLYFHWGSGVVLTNAKFIVQLEEGTTATTPEKYTGGQASPNTDYEQPNKSCGDNVNMFDVENWVTKGNNSNYYSYSNGELTIKALDARGFSNFNESEKIYLPNGTYYLGNIGNAGPRIYNNGTDYPLLTNKFEVTLGYIYLKLVSSNVITCKPKIEPGDKSSSYSPYGMGCITEKMENKNFACGINTISSNGITSNFNNGKLQVSGTITSNWASLTKPQNINLPAGTYTISRKNLNTGMRLILRLYYEDGTNTSHYFVGTQTKQITITTTKKAIQYYFNTDLCTAGNIYNFEDYIQIEEGSTATLYEQHQEQIFTIPTQQPMRSVGEVRDLFFKNTADSPYYNSELVENKWYEMHNISQAILNGSETSWTRQSIKTIDTYRFRVTLGNNKKANSALEVVPVLCNRLKAVSPGDTWNNIEGICIDSAEEGYVFVYIEDLSNNTLNEFKTWLSQNNLILDYILKNPTYTLCTDEQVQALEAYIKARTYKGITHIYSEDEVPGYVDMTYYKDLETYLSNEIGEVKQAIVALGGVV